MGFCVNGDEPLGFLKTENVFVYSVNEPRVNLDKLVIRKDL
jgi:hypothetical protein